MSVFIIFYLVKWPITTIYIMSLQYYHAYWLAETSRTGQEKHHHRLSVLNNSTCPVRWIVHLIMLITLPPITARNATIAYGAKREIKNGIRRVLFLFMWSR